MSNELLAILGGLVTFLLSVNGWYFRQIVTDLQEIKINLARLNESHDNSLELTRKHDREIDALKERIHRLEGHVPTLMRMIEEKDGGASGH